MEQCMRGLSQLQRSFCLASIAWRGLFICAHVEDRLLCSRPKFRPDRMLPHRGKCSSVNMTNVQLKPHPRYNEREEDRRQERRLKEDRQQEDRRREAATRRRSPTRRSPKRRRTPLKETGRRSQRRRAVAEKVKERSQRKVGAHNSKIRESPPERRRSRVKMCSRRFAVSYTHLRAHET